MFTLCIMPNLKVTKQQAAKALFLLTMLDALTVMLIINF